MTDDTVTKVVRRVIEDGWNRGRLDAIDDVVALEYVRHSAARPIRGPEEFKAWIAEVRAAFPDFRNHIHEILSDDGRGAARLSATGTHRGPFLGIEPTGRKIAFDVAVVVHLRGGMLHEEWEYLDTGSVLAQLGGA